MVHKDNRKLPKLPGQPESLESMRSRFSKAIAHAVSVEKVAKDPRNAYYPSKYRTHVFDSEDGIRLIVSRDRDGDQEVIHVSASLSKKAAREFGNLSNIVTRVAEIWQFISGCQASPIGRQAQLTDRTLHFAFRPEDIPVGVT